MRLNWDLNKYVGKPSCERPLYEPPTDRKPWQRRMWWVRHAPWGWWDHTKGEPWELLPCEATAAPEVCEDE